jgi:hypothetical protein
MLEETSLNLSQGFRILHVGIKYDGGDLEKPKKKKGARKKTAQVTGCAQDVRHGSGLIYNGLKGASNRTHGKSYVSGRPMWYTDVE